MMTLSSSTIRISAALATKGNLSYSSGRSIYPKYRFCVTALQRFNPLLTRGPSAARVGKGALAAATMRLSRESGGQREVGDEGLYRHGAHRAHLRHRPQLGRRLQARDP